MDQTCRIALVGIAGYGEEYLKELDKENRLDWIQGVVDIYPEKSSYYETLKKLKVPVYSSLDQFFANEKADLTIISTPIHLHAVQAITAMENGSHVLCEKPMTSSLKDAERMREVRDRTGKFTAIGFNWSFSESVTNLKKDIQAGIFGKAVKGKALALWPRNEAYYNRSSWAGKKFSSDGAPIFDSIANNATSHFLHHLLYVLGDTQKHSAKLTHAEVELYRVNPIETFDTCAFRGKTEKNVELLYLASHAVIDQRGPQFEMEFEQASVVYEVGSPMKAVWMSGEEKVYGDPEKEKLHKLEVCIEAVLKDNHEVRCTIESAYSHMLAIQAMHEAVPDVPSLPESLIKVEEESKVSYVEDLFDEFMETYKEWKLPSEMKLSWTWPSQRVDIRQGAYTY
ncbi:Gfo/Idh/MocA family oxidoreductase [Halobacillus salinarum]|uniref:Gfo/Idh/MocA family oxidoreductase n=1 Tax=Halobacillus salinarum TaxID=2932257 RepID=A0ABY4EJ83_9BACI|nr:Gfo/Idh/MocA family oxidoreductase [Halobacillus salinarum]UOQ44112.1 Gfo/Idh/MocA family oxidoreductase [Halobacillus salinarum]